MKWLDSLLPHNCCAGCGKFIEPHEDDGLGVCTACREEFARPQPPLCIKCGRHTDHGELCVSCSRISHAFDEANVVFDYDGAARRAILLLKFGGQGCWTDFLAANMAEQLPDAWRPDVVVGVPTHPLRRLLWLRSTGAVLAKRVAVRLGLPVNAALRRSKYVKPMFRVKLAERRTLAERSYALTRRAAVEGKRVLLVDDILTTGASADACARLLKQAGAARVYLMCAAGTLAGKREQEK